MGCEEDSPKPTWRRKTAEERHRDDPARLIRRFRLTAPLMIGGVGALVGAAIPLIVVIALGDISFAWIFGTIGALVFGLLSALLAFMLQAFGWLSPPSRIRAGICTRCFKLTLDGKRDVCDCGGTLEDVDGWTLNRCPKCGYDLRGGGQRCPECGVEILAWVTS